MALLILALLLVPVTSGCDISFNNKTGIPFSMQFGAPYVSGFEVDGKGDFYFSGADSIIRKISGEDHKVLFTTHVKGLRDGQIGLVGENLWVVSRADKSTVRLTSLNSSTGEIKSDTLLTFDRTIGIANMGHVVDQKIFFSFANRPPNLNYVKIDPVSMSYLLVKNKNDLDLGPDSLSYKLPAYFGKLDSTMVFCAISDDEKSRQEVAKIALIDKAGKILGHREISLGDTEMLRPATSYSLERLAAGKVYFLRKKLKEKRAKVISADLNSLATPGPAPSAP